MRTYKERDIRFYGQRADGTAIEGDLIPGAPDADGLVDFALTEDFECARQDMINRIRTQTTDWRSHPNIGGDLELLEGEPNTRETAAKAAEQIAKTLSFDGRFDLADLSIRPVPTDIYSIDVYTILNTKDEPVYVKTPLNL
jgi:hypothetical protein